MPFLRLFFFQSFLIFLLKGLYLLILLQKIKIYYMIFNKFYFFSYTYSYTSKLLHIFYPKKDCPFILGQSFLFVIIK